MLKNDLLLEKNKKNLIKIVYNIFNKFSHNINRAFDVIVRGQYYI